MSIGPVKFYQVHFIRPKVEITLSVCLDNTWGTQSFSSLHLYAQLEFFELALKVKGAVQYVRMVCYQYRDSDCGNDMIIGSGSY